jgi:hypothetical protein
MPGGLTFGLTMRYLGMSFGIGGAPGCCAAFDTLLPPILKLFLLTIQAAETITQIAYITPGKITLLEVFMSLIGIVVRHLLEGYNRRTLKFYGPICLLFIWQWTSVRKADAPRWASGMARSCSLMTMTPFLGIFQE